MVPWGMSARDSALASALVLFNDRGVGPVTTNHIAAHAGISPGNLYYHFPNKAAMVRSLFDQMNRRWDQDLGASAPPSRALFDGLLEATFAILVDYRFFYREPVALTRDDPELAERYRLLRRRGRQDFLVLRAALADAGVVPALAPEAAEALADLCWLTTEFWVQGRDLSGQSLDAEGRSEGVALLRSLVLGYSP